MIFDQQDMYTEWSKQINQVCEKKGTKIYSLINAILPLVDRVGRAIEAVQLSENSKESTDYLNYGVNRRLLAIHAALLMMVQYIPPGQFLKYGEKDPLEYEWINLLINSIYINIAGLLDNMAWFLAKFTGMQPEECESDIRLFCKKYWKRRNLKELGNLVRNHDKWHRELKNIRDPIAHRIPLYIPQLEPQCPSNEGKVQQVMLQSLEEGKSWELYPTLIKDLSHVVEIIDVILDHLNN